jgi:hypothetical protein
MQESCLLDQGSSIPTSQTHMALEMRESSSTGKISISLLLRSQISDLRLPSYIPDFTLCLLGIVLFTLAFLSHALQVWYYRLWSFSPLTFACLMEVTGYIFRALSSRKDPYRITYFVVEYFFIVTAPVLISASIYVCLTKLITWAEAEGTDISNRSRFLRRKFILLTFISVDVVTTAMQVTGAGIIGGATSKQKDPTTGNNVLLAGLAIQTAAFAVFLVLLIVVTFAICKSMKTPFLAVLPIASVLVFVRTIFRLVETSQGVFGYLSTHEGFFAGLEFAPMVVAVWLLAIWYPGRWMSNTVVSRRKVEGV